MFGPLQFIGGMIWNIMFVPPLAYVFWALVGMGLAVWFVLKYYKAPPEEFAIERFGEVVNRDLERSFDVLGVRTNDAKLLKGLIKIGDVTKLMHEKGMITKTFELEPDGRGIVEKGNENHSLTSEGESQAVPSANLSTKIPKTIAQKIAYDLHLFEVNVGDSFLNIFGKGNERFVIDTNLVRYDPMRNIYQINENANLLRYGDVFVSSDIAKDFVTDIAWKRGLENQVEETMNLAKKTTYLEMKHSKKVDIMEKQTALEQSKYQQYKRQALLEEED